MTRDDFKRESDKTVSIITDRSWASYPPTYRRREMKMLANWVSSGEGGSVVGLPGCGRSNLLGFLCYRPEVFQRYLLPQANAAALIPIDLNNLPANNLSTLYRVILRSFYRFQIQFDSTLQQKITVLYETYQSEQDPFLVQSGLQELLLLCQAQRKRVVLILNRFDRFCQITAPEMVNTLRGLRDEFKDTLCYIAGMTQEVAYLPDPTVLGHMYELLDNYICWVGAMKDEDATNLIARAIHATQSSPSEVDVKTMLVLSGGYPALLRAICQWWLTTENKPAHPKWLATLLNERSLQHRLKKIWNGLTREEQFILSELQKLQLTARNGLANEARIVNGQPRMPDKGYQDFVNRHVEVLIRLAEKGICRQTDSVWYIAAELLVNYVAKVKGRGRGRIWLDENTGEVYQGQTVLKGLTALENSVLTFIIRHPRIKHTKTDLIINTWPDELRQKGVSDNSLYQIIFNIRKEIEPNPTKASYLVNWRGKPEGGYQFFPEGRPG